jgi:hypothetical protein
MLNLAHWVLGLNGKQTSAKRRFSSRAKEGVENQVKKILSDTDQNLIVMARK